MSALGVINVLTPFIDDTLFIGGRYEGVNRAILDGLSVVLTAWVIAGGTEGWNSTTRWVESAFNPKKV